MLQETFYGYGDYLKTHEHFRAGSVNITWNTLKQQRREYNVIRVTLEHERARREA